MLLCTACALVDTPSAELAVAQSAIRDAESAGAAQRAPAELASARDRLARAHIEARRHHYDEAQFLSEQAEADARLAAVKSRATSAEAALDVVRGERPAR
jgi:hypothetical protein